MSRLPLIFPTSWAPDVVDFPAVVGFHAGVPAVVSVSSGFPAVGLP
jgi:hypothetical protein